MADITSGFIQNWRHFFYSCYIFRLLLLLCLPVVVFGNTLQAPRFITAPSSSGSLVGEDRTKILQCQALGYPPPEYRWVKDGLRLSEFSSEHFFKIQTVTREDAGSYHCYAKNEVGIIVSEKIQLKVSYMSQFDKSDVPSQDLRVRMGQAAVFPLPFIDSVPRPAVKWQSDDRSSLYGIKYVSTINNELVILSVDKSDEKSYRARATNTQLGQEETSKYIFLEVYDKDSADVPPVILIPPKDITMVKGTTVSVLQCIANAKPLDQLEMIWLKNGRPIESVGIPFSFNDLWNRTLSLLQAETNHAGTYTCQVRMKTGGPVLSESAVVTVIEKPYFTGGFGLETNGEYGKDINLICPIQGGVPAPNIVWIRNGVSVSEIPDLRYSISKNNSLRINFMRLEDSGMFECIASNEAGEVVAYTWLRVKTSSPVLTTPPRNITVFDGQDGTITCGAEGSPTPNTTWYFEDGQITYSGRIQILDQGSLLIAKVRVSDSGRYNCTRTNEAGSASGHAWLSVIVRTQIIQPPVDSKVILGHIALLHCKVSSDASVPYDVMWYHDNKRIESAKSYRITIDAAASLRIAEARASDAGEYVCEVTSSGGNDKHAANLDVIELPYAPSAVTAERVMTPPKAVNVSWTAGFNGNSPIIKFIVQYRFVPQEGVFNKDDLSWTTIMSNVSSSTRSVLLVHLHAAHAYIFRVSAVNSVGEGPSSIPSNRIVLPQEPPSGPPVGLVGSARSISEIMIQWQPPAEDKQNGIILGYIVRYRLFGYHESPWSYRNITNPLQRTYLITDLITWKDYEVHISAYNLKGPGEYTRSIKVKTKEGVPLAPPTNVRVIALSSHSARVWWLPPDPQKINGINQGYKIQAWRGDPDEFGLKPSASVSVAPDLLNPLSEQTSLINGLSAWVAYNITVLCFTNPGDGRRSLPEGLRTHQDFPGQVTNLHFDDITDRGVKIIWEEPKQPNGIILGYIVRYMVKDRFDTLVERNVSSVELGFRLNQLKPTTHYTFEVYAVTQVGRGKPSIATIQSGIKPVLPSPPSHLAISNISPFSVLLQFTPGFDGNSSITEWIVEATSARNLTWNKIYSVAEPEAMAIRVLNLIPYMEYRLRLRARNVVGLSAPSEPTRQFQTIQAPPRHSPQNVTIRAMSATQLRVRWIPLSQGDWFGIPRGYNISYRILDDSSRLHSISIEDSTVNSFVLEELEEFTLYEVLLQAYNDLGSSDPSPVVVARTQEAVPGSGPSDISVESTSSTTILVKWGEVAKWYRNGIIDGYKVYYGAKDVAFLYKHINSNSTKQTTLTELKKYVMYSIQVLAFTRIGDGKLSTPPIQVRTFEDVPGAPSNVSFPDVSVSTARIIWDVPKDPNGKILSYRVTWRLYEPSNIRRIGATPNYTKQFLPTDRTFRAVGLQHMSYYMFEVTARTSLGWGYTTRCLVYTTNNREIPQPPSAPRISQSQVQAREINFSWNPGNDGYAPLRYYTVQYSESGGTWHTVPERVDPTVSDYTVHALKPFTHYKFRIQSVNDIGPSGWSLESNETMTLPAAPSITIASLSATPITRTDVKVRWIPLKPSDFYGDTETAGYVIEYREISNFPLPLVTNPRVEVSGFDQSEIVLENLSITKNYEIVVLAVNSQGVGPPSRPVNVYVGEAVPTGSPLGLSAEAVSATEVRLSWQAPKIDEQNGDLLGYKIFYHSIPANSRNSEEIEVISAQFTVHSLIFLDMYTNYTMSVLAFNPAGDGPRSNSISVRTLQGIPGPPSNLRFTEITMNTLKVSWDLPKRPNGNILGYVVGYKTNAQGLAHSQSKSPPNPKMQLLDVTTHVTDRFMFVRNLDEEATYSFSVRAQTIDFGPPVYGNVTTGPQPGSPGRPRNLILSKTVSAVKLSWNNGNSGKAPILGYYIESRRKDEDKWKTEIKSDTGAVQEYTISYQNLVPMSTYTFRVISYNKYGISYPANSLEDISTPSKRYLEYDYLMTKPWFREPWFLVALAALSIIIIIMVVAVLCVKSKTFKYKDQAKQYRIDEGMNEIASTFELRQSRRGTLSRPNTLSRRTGTMKSTISRRSNVNFAGIGTSTGRALPRPSPARYSDEDSAKDDYEDTDSLTEKPSEISSTDSQGTESDRENGICMGGDDPRHSFVNHYANVNSTFRQSWKKQKAVAVPTLPRSGGLFPCPAVDSGSVAPISNPRGYSSFTESDQDGSSAVVSLNGTQIVLNNMARSRAPLPGFSSFV